MLCECGKEIQSSSYIGYTFVHYNEYGKIIYAICEHGFVVIDNREVDEKPKEV